MKILLVSVPLEFPLAVYSLAAQIAATPATAHVCTTILHLNASNLHDYRRKNAEIWRYIAKVQEERPDVIAFSVYPWSSIPVAELVEITARVYPHTVLVVGGPELASTKAAEPWCATGRVAAAVRGEGEITFVALIERLCNGRTFEGLEGCSWSTPGGVVHEKPRAPINDLSNLASAYLDGWIPDEMFDRGGASTGMFPRAFVETYRGCYMQCSYCQWGNGSTLRFPFPDERVKAELTWLISRRVRHVWIVDAMFGYKKNTAKDILRHIIAMKEAYGADTGVVCYHNQDFYDEELFSLYRQANVMVEVDLQSTNKDVLTRVGRAKWYIDSFDRHRAAFRKDRVPTTGAADLIIGLPGDNYESFKDSVDFMLERGMDVNLYQTSIIPDTPMACSLEADRTVFSPIAPRAVFRNETFSLSDMVKARLLGHGVDFFGRCRRTAEVLWRFGYPRPVDLCERIGDLFWERFGVMYGDTHTHDAVLASNYERMDSVLDELCPHASLVSIVRDLFRLEWELAVLAGSSSRAAAYMASHVVPDGSEEAERWLNLRPRYRRECVREVRLEHRLDQILSEWHRTGELPAEAIWRALAPSPRIALVYRSAITSVAYRLVDPNLTHELLLRLSGHFTVAECLDNFVTGWRQHDVKPILNKLVELAHDGLLDVEAAQPAVAGSLTAA